ncbi:MAG: TrmH family RNA methyltransferase [Candidatus Saccharimonadales bacterium]
MIPIALILDNIRSTYNVGSILRTADCFGVQEIFFSGYTPYPISKADRRMPHIAKKLHEQIAKTALGAESTLPFSVFDTIATAIDTARISRYKIIGIEQDTNSIPLDSCTASPSQVLLSLGMSLMVLIHGRNLAVMSY